MVKTRTTKSARQFGLELRGWAAETPEEANKVRRGLAAEVLRGVVLKSPVDTGRFRGNWQVAEGSPATEVLENADKGGGATISDGIAQIEGIEPGSDIWISNNLPYAARIEDGWSKQAPGGVVALTVAEVEGI